MQFIDVNKELPKKGEKVLVMCIKEMIYMGSEESNTSDWMDEGDGERVVIAWKRKEEITGDITCLQ